MIIELGMCMAFLGIVLFYLILIAKIDIDK